MFKDNKSFEDTYEYDSVTVAFYIVAWANQHKVTINLTKTQKLLYIAYGAHLVLHNNRLCNEHPQAWPYGPVFPRTREALLKEDLYSVEMGHSRMGNVKDNEYLKNLIEFVFEGFGNYTADQLTAWSHSPNSPWDKTQNMDRFKWGMEMPDNYIRDYFRSIIT